MTTNRFRQFVLVFLLISPAQAFAQENVDSRLQDLEETIQVLESRVSTLEAVIHKQNASAPVPTGRDKWRKLRKGMSEGDVEMLLGSPSKIDALGIATFWHYGDASGGDVWFDPDTRKVKGWTEP